MPSLRERAASGVIWTALQIWVVRLTTTATFVVLSRQLSPADFGLVALAMAVVTILNLLTESGLTSYVIRVPNLTPQIISTAFWTTMGLATGLALLMFALARPAAAVFREPGLGGVLQWLSLALVLTGLTSVPSAMLKREMRFKALAVRGTTATACGAVVAIAMAITGFGVWALVAQALVRGVVSSAMLWRATTWSPWSGWSSSHAKEMMSFGSRLLGADLLLQARDRGQDFALAAVGGAGMLGAWAVAGRFVRIIQEVGSSVVVQVATPAFARLQDDKARLFKVLEVSLSLAGAVLFPLMLLLAITSQELVPFLLGDQWGATALVAQIMALTAVVTAFSYFDRSLFVALDLLQVQLRLNLLSTLSQLAIVVIMAPFGLTAMAWALLVRAVILVPIRFVTLHRTAGVPFGVLIRPMRVLAAGVAMAMVAWAVHLHLSAEAPWAQSLASVAVGAAAYPVALWLVARPTFAAISEEVRRMACKGDRSSASPEGQAIMAGNPRSSGDLIEVAK